MIRLLLLTLLLSGDQEIQVFSMNSREVVVSCRSGTAPRIKQTNTNGEVLLRCDQ